MAGKGIFRQGDYTQGHPCWPPTLPAEWSSKVTCNNKYVVLEGHRIVPHCCPDNGCHDGVFVGAHKVSCEGRNVIITDDPVTCGDKAGPGSGNVTIGG